MNVTIIGGGNIGTQFAIEFSRKGHKVTVFSSRAGEFSKNLEMIGETEEILYTARIAKATDDLESAVKEAELIIITLPAFMLEDIAVRLYPYVKSGINIGVIPGTGGVEFYFANYSKKNITIFGLQRVPAVARLVEYGKKVRVRGKREKLFLASFPRKRAKELAELMSEIFEIPCEYLDNYLCVTLTPSNSLLHTSRMYSLFCDYYEGKVYPKIPLFYEEWDQKSSETLFLCDTELQNICNALTGLDMKSVVSLRTHYECKTTEEMTLKMRSIRSLQGIKTPMLKYKNGYIPDFESRYFRADFPYGLAVIKQVADLVKVDVEGMTKLLQWYQDTVPHAHERVDISKYGINTIEDLLRIYQ